MFCIGSTGITILPDIGSSQNGSKDPSNNNCQDDREQRKPPDSSDGNHLEILRKENNSKQLDETQTPAIRNPRESSAIQAKANGCNHRGDCDGRQKSKERGNDARVSNGHLTKTRYNNGALDRSHGLLKTFRRILDCLKFRISYDLECSGKVGERSTLNNGQPETNEDFDTPSKYGAKTHNPERTYRSPILV